MLFVQDDAAQLRYRQEERRTRPHHEAGLLPGGQTAEDLLPSCRRLVAMIEKQGHMGQDAGRIPAQLAGKSHFGSQQEDAPALLHAMPDQLQIDSRLAAAGHPKQQDRCGPLRLQRSTQGLQGPLLVCIELKGPGRGRKQLVSGLIGLRVAQSHEAGLQQRSQGRSTAGSQIPSQLATADLSPFMQIVQYLALPCGLRPYRPGRIHPQHTEFLPSGIPARRDKTGLPPAQGHGQGLAQIRFQFRDLLHRTGKIPVRRQPADAQIHLTQALRQDMPEHTARLQSLPDGQIPCQRPDLLRKQGGGLQRPGHLLAGDAVRKIAVLQPLHQDACPQRTTAQGDGHAQAFLPELFGKDVGQGVRQGAVRSGKQSDTGKHGTS